MECLQVFEEVAAWIGCEYVGRVVRRRMSRFMRKLGRIAVCSGSLIASRVVQPSGVDGELAVDGLAADSERRGGVEVMQAK